MILKYLLYKIQEYKILNRPCLKVLFQITLFLPISMLGQTILIEDIEYDNVLQKIDDIFTSNFDTECSDINFIVSLNMREESLDIFNRGNSDFPFERGVVLSTGIAEAIVGPNDVLDTSTGVNEFGTYLYITELLDYRIGNRGQYSESKAIIFTVESSSDLFSLRYIFASEVYNNGNIECFNGNNQYQDGFAIIITGPGIVADTYDHDNDTQTPEIEYAHAGKNIALLPNGITEVGLHSVHQNEFCSNEGFEEFYEEIPLGTGAISSNGMTTPFIAESSIIPGELYEVEIMFTNRGNPQLDSVLFFEFPNNPEVPNLEPEYILCLDENGESIAPQTVIETEIDNPDYAFLWFYENDRMANETGNLIFPQLTGEYSVEVIGPSGCSRLYATHVIASSTPFDLSYEISGDIFTDTQNVTIIVEGIGDYMFQFNGSPPQESPLFQNISPGQYDVRAIDKNGCGFLEKVVTVVGYPKFFTPNSDGYNDVWNIKLSDIGWSGTISIFNRYGKLLKIINSEEKGWDGTLNGNPLPSDDYWFKITFSNNETYMSHFSLKR